jgi:hypothetical protein
MIRSLIPIVFFTAAAHAWQPAPDSMLNDWGAKVTPDQAWREYPRPAMAREPWTNLNGLWKYAVTPKTAGTAFPFDLGENGRFDGFIKIVGEFGGHGFPVKDHLWNPNARNWGYGGLPKNKEEWIERYKTSIRKLAELRKVGIAGGIYTQTSDVEGEINGLITYDRKVRKLSPADLAKILKDSGLMNP